MSIKAAAANRRARHQYHFEDTYKAGLVLLGSEIKAIRVGQVSIREGFELWDGGEARLAHVHVA